MPTGSGYLNKYWFNFLWFGDCNAILSIALTSNPEMISSWMVFVDVLSENVFKGEYPVWRFSRASEEKGIISIQWYPLALLEEKLKDLLGDPEIKSVYTLDGKVGYRGRRQTNQRQSKEFLSSHQRRR